MASETFFSLFLNAAIARCRQVSFSTVFGLARLVIGEVQGNLVMVPEINCARSSSSYLLECRKYNEQTKNLRKEVGAGKVKVEKLLGYPTVIKHTMEFVTTTKWSDI